MRLSHKIYLVVGTLVLISLACTIGQQRETPTDTANAQPAAPVETATETPSPTVEEILPSETPTNTPEPSSTVIPTATSTSIPCDLAGWGRDVTIPDGKKIDPGKSFTKTWELYNMGSCPWTSGYQAIFVGGDQMGAPASLPFTSGSIPPGGSVQISVNMTAPDTPGTYIGNWKLRNPSGLIFSFENGNPFYVNIKVPAFTDTPAPSGPQFTMSYKNVHSCGVLKYATVKVNNTGSEAFESARIYVRDLDALTVLYGPGTSSVPFMANANDCPPGASAVNPGDSAFIAVSIGAAPTSGHDARFELTLCTENGMGGDCVTHSSDFTIP
jgi:hypothetical protein